MNEWHCYEQRSVLDAELARHLASLLERDLKSHGQASLAVSGGRTPAGLFAALSHCPLAWEKVAVTLVDERWVNADHQDSNERLLREQLLQNKARDAKLVPLKSDHCEATAALAEVTGRIDQLHSPFSAVVLGMGDDGHTASWFPQAANLAALLDPESRAAVAACDPVTAPHQRITLTLARVVQSTEIVVHITGEKKRELITAAALGGYPISAILEQTSTPTSIWWAP